MVCKAANKQRTALCCRERVCALVQRIVAGAGMTCSSSARTTLLSGLSKFPTGAMAMNELTNLWRPLVISAEEKAARPSREPCEWPT